MPSEDTGQSTHKDRYGLVPILHSEDGWAIDDSRPHYLGRPGEPTITSGFLGTKAELGVEGVKLLFKEVRAELGDAKIEGVIGEHNLQGEMFFYESLLGYTDFRGENIDGLGWVVSQLTKFSNSPEGMTLSVILRYAGREELRKMKKYREDVKDCERIQYALRDKHALNYEIKQENDRKEKELRWDEERNRELQPKIDELKIKYKMLDEELRTYHDEYYRENHKHPKPEDMPLKLWNDYNELVYRHSSAHSDISFVFFQLQQNPYRPERAESIPDAVERISNLRREGGTEGLPPSLPLLERLRLRHAKKQGLNDICLYAFEASPETGNVLYHQRPRFLDMSVADLQPLTQVKDGRSADLGKVIHSLLATQKLRAGHHDQQTLQKVRFAETIQNQFGVILEDFVRYLHRLRGKTE